MDERVWSLGLTDHLDFVQREKRGWSRVEGYWLCVWLSMLSRPGNRARCTSLTGVDGFEPTLISSESYVPLRVVNTVTHHQAEEPRIAPSSETDQLPSFLTRGVEEPVYKSIDRPCPMMRPDID